MRIKIASLILILAMTVSLVSCSKNLGPETIPSTTLPPETVPTETTEPTATETTETEPLGPEPTSVPVVSKMPIKKYGMLYVNNGQLTTKNKTPVVLRGMSSDVISECQGFFGAETVKTLAEDWGVEVLRIAVPADSVEESYVKNSEKYFKQTCDIIDLCIKQGIYVIVNWHPSKDGNPLANQKKAIEFFTRIAGVYTDSQNVIYEISNEPNGTRTVKSKNKTKKVNVDWDNTVKPYADAVVKAIRAIDNNNIIIIGTSDYSRDIDKAAKNPVKGTGICYSVHFNAYTDGEELRNKIADAQSKGICVIATEWKTTDSSGVSAPHAENTAKWLDFLDEHKISWCNSYIGGNNSTTSNALIFGGERYTLEDIFAGHWPKGLLSESGIIVRNRLLAAQGTEQPEVEAKPEELPNEFPDDYPDDEGDSGDIPEGDNEDKPEE